MSVTNKMDQVDMVIKSSLSSDVVLINQLSQYIIGSGGKRLRPRLVLLSAGVCGYQEDNDSKAAAIIEFIHTATLLHDDVVDDSDLRRGKETANAVFGNEAAVLTGDFLYSRSFQMMVDIKNLEVMSVLANTTNVIAEGEVMQLMNIQELELTENEYFEIIYRKTAALFETALDLGAILGSQPDSVRTSLKNYGRHLGNSFQMMDDILDYKSNSETIGKNIGDDLAEGKMTLPLIHARLKANAEQKSCIDDAILNSGVARLSEVQEILAKTKSIEYTISVAEKESDLAVASLANIADSIYKDDLINIAKTAIKRTT